MTAFRKWYRHNGGFALALGTVTFLFALVVLHPIYGPRTELLVDKTLRHPYVEITTDSGYSMNVVLHNPPAAKPIWWDSQDTTIARVNQNGLVIATKVGKVTICANWALSPVDTSFITVRKGKGDSIGTATATASLVDHTCRSITMTSEVPLSVVPNTIDTMMVDRYGIRVRILAKTIKANRHSARPLVDDKGWIDSLTFIDGSTVILTDLVEHPEIKSGQAYLFVLIPCRDGSYFPTAIQRVDQYWRQAPTFRTTRPQPQG